MLAPDHPKHGSRANRTGTMSPSSFETVRSIVLKLGLCLLVVLMAGLPVVDPVHVAVVLAAWTVIVASPLRDRWRPISSWLCITALVTLAAGLLSSPPRIEEGHNFVVFLAEDDAALEQALPDPVYELVRQQFHERYPLDLGCRSSTPGCWRRSGPLPRSYAFAADGIWQKSRWSRTVSGFDFASARDARLGFLNSSHGGDLTANWYDSVSSAFDPDRSEPPYFVRYAFGDSHDGASICWRGQLAVRSADKSRWELSRSDAETCFALREHDLPAEVIGWQMGPDSPLAMRYVPAPEGTLARLGGRWLPLLAILCLLAAVLRPRLQTLAPIGIVGAVSIALFGASLWPQHRAPLFVGGTDPLTHWGFGRWILESATSGDWRAALEGGETVFYFMPGYRYLRALEMSVFGDSGMLSWLLLVLTPMAVFLLAGRLSNAWIAFLCTLALLLNYSYAESVANYSESVSYPVALLGLLVGLHALTGKLRRDCLFFAALLLAVAVLLRPNLLPASGLFLAYLGWCQSRHHWLSAGVALVLGFAPTLLLLLHNLSFGGEFVLLTRASDIPENLLAPPSLYLEALGDLLSGRTESAAVGRVGDHLSSWLGIGGGMYVALLLASLLIALLFAAVTGRLAAMVRAAVSLLDRPLVALCIFAIGLQAVLLFYQSTGRYGQLAQIVSGIVFIVLFWRVLQQLRALRDARA